ncbi:MAG: threonylcarbamoyl-AMP synthase [Candidatus Omnitrophota bacterium]|nr:MAG: threonylcarbamoyl-AMP synthase [Candidatus Omnitrophota bacterium]RKY46553.1 MAG: threonylcarbamoyl-AMP synthase [Candidatus Omnitrophota bacterium]HDN86509.1 threonylcarbamoyl-AMP synthase [Candidatus Omnitrophota bacterium]
MKRLDALACQDISFLGKEVKEILTRGGIVALPTETVYGLAVLPTNKSAVERLYQIKHRDSNKPFSLHIPDVEKALSFLSVLPPYGYRLLEKYWPGPLTIVYYSKEGEKIGVRVPDHKILAEILRVVGSPVYLPSANLSGEKEAVSAKEVEEKFDGNIDLIVDAGPPVYFKPSTVIDLTYHPFKILREGAISVKEIVDIYVKKRIVFVCTGNTCRSVMGEHLLKKYLSEYNPHTFQRYEIISRGLHPLEGSPLSPAVAEILKREEGIVLEDHKSKRLDRKTILSSDLVFTMSDVQKEHIVKLEPTSEPRVFCLKKFLPLDMEKDIPDPMGKPYEVYFQVYELIKKAILELRDWL